MNNNNNDNLAAPDTGSALTGDDAIMNQINQALRSNATTARSPIDVAAQGATVTLSGTVGSQDVKRVAEQLARGVPGVVDVTNELVIGDNAGGGVFGIFGNHDNDADGGTGDNGGVNTGNLGAIPLVGGTSGASSGAGIGYGVPLAMGLAGEGEGSSASGETRQSRNADAEEEDMS
jgi:hypothetical protein